MYSANFAMRQTYRTEEVPPCWKIYHPKTRFLARDADPRLTGPLEDCCREAGVPVAGGHTMAQLGRACGIDVPTAAAALLAKEKPLPTE